MSELEFERRKARTPAVTSGTRSQSDAVAGPIRSSEQIQKAVQEFDLEAEALPPVPDHPEVLSMLMSNAKILLANGEQRLAVNILRSVLMRHPTHLDGLMQMGLVLRDDRPEEAIKCFRALVKLSRDMGAQILVAETLYLMERDQAALEAYREVLRSVISDDAKLFDIYKNVGNIHVRAGDLEAAEEFYNKAFSLKPDSDVLMVNYGTLEIHRENLSVAVERFRRAVELNANNDKAWVGLAIVHRQMGDFELAWANVERALDINEANRTAIRLLAEWGAGSANWWAVIPRLQDYLATEGEDAEMAFMLAKILTQVAQLHAARLEMERVLALDPAIEGGEALMNALDAELTRLARLEEGCA